MKNHVTCITLCMLLALLCPISLTWAQEPPHTWSATFNKIHNKDILQKLRTYKKQGWEAMFRATKKSAQQLIFEGELRLEHLQEAIARDEYLLARAKSKKTVLPTAIQCKAALKDIHNVFFPVCDKQLRQEELLAVSGMLELLRGYEKVLPQQIYTGRYGKNFGDEVVAKVTLRVVASTPPNPSQEKTASPGVQAHIVTIADDKSVVIVRQGEKVIVQMITKGKRVQGFVVQPATGVLDMQKGIVHFSVDRLMVLKATNPGEVTISFMGPVKVLPIKPAESSGYMCVDCWSGYVVSGGPFFGIQGSWIVPAVATPDQPSAYGEPYGSSSTWIGLDGWGEAQLIQTGTSQTYNEGFLGIGRGVSYYAWWQMLPQFGTEQSIPNPVFPGDAMLASIIPTPGSNPNPNANFSWLITLTNITQGWTFVTNQVFNGPLDTADWIMEDPSMCFIDCWRQSFANYGKVWFDLNNRILTAAPSGPGFVPNWVSPNFDVSQQIAINQNNTIFSTPSNPDGDSDGFYIKYSTGAAVQVNPPGPRIETNVLGPATVNQVYSQGLLAFVEPTPFEPSGPVWSWSIASGMLPIGLSLDPSGGIISGMPTVLGTSTFSVIAKDTVTGAFSQAQNLNIQVLPSPYSTLKIVCGSVYPSGSISVAVDGNAVPCGGSLILAAGNHHVSATANGSGGPYKISYYDACSSTGQVTLVAGNVAECDITATQQSAIENRCPKNGQICCESSPTGCKKCVTPPQTCD